MQRESLSTTHSSRTSGLVPGPVLAADIDLRRLASVLALVVLVAAGTLLALWITGAAGPRTILTSVMKVNTCCCLVLMAASLLLSIRGAGAWARAFTLIAALIASATVVEYVVGVNL